MILKALRLNGITWEMGSLEYVAVEDLNTQLRGITMFKGQEDKGEQTERKVPVMLEKNQDILVSYMPSEATISRKAGSKTDRDLTSTEK